MTEILFMVRRRKYEIPADREPSFSGEENLFRMNCVYQDDCGSPEPNGFPGWIRTGKKERYNGKVQKNHSDDKTAH